MSKLFEAIRKLQENQQTEFSIKPNNLNREKENQTKKNKIYLYIIICSLLLGCLVLMLFFTFEQKPLKRQTKLTNRQSIKKPIPQNNYIHIFKKQNISSVEQNFQQPQKNKNQKTLSQKENVKKIETQNTIKTKEKQIINSTIKNKFNQEKLTQKDLAKERRTLSLLQDNKTLTKNNIKVNNNTTNKQFKISSNIKNQFNNYLLLAEEARQSGQYEKAIYYYQQALAEEKDTQKKADILNNMGAIYLLQNKPYLAQITLEKAVKISDDPSIIYNLAIAYLKQQKTKKTCSLLNNAKNLTPELISIKLRFCSN
ncbi:hypothetical protein Thein_1880 [Thermodesulfatator indicus DSM 15286]|uniref:Tetratricopeptide TPR_1 repeat-containing protein n=1 Tax=Thermodesulfatator indicus (strain DSM 15286 / JCM 11887 / CIR29812) TaxID=667014 RepID=F8ACA0_THEID|nr:tetratricopeptide repeat protein [Thermodesulfatator indicus]AEH45735.1 hypothetical protein Thein_1880 [Thermodesulfatator indicus DSM 15286]